MSKKYAKDSDCRRESALDQQRCRSSDQHLRIYLFELTRRSEQIADQPLSGRKVPEYQSEDIRELIEKPYRIIYRIKKDQIDVVAVIHSAQLLPDQI